jgi:hypothetical protein
VVVWPDEAPAEIALPGEPSTTNSRSAPAAFSVVGVEAGRGARRTSFVTWQGDRDGAAPQPSDRAIGTTWLQIDPSARTLPVAFGLPPVLA